MDGGKISLALRAAYLSMHRRADAELQALGVTSNQFVVLSTLAESDGVSQRTLVNKVASDPNTIRPILVALEEKGLVVREANTEDRRIWSVKLTKKGRSTQAKLHAKTQRFRDSLASAFSDSEIDTLVNLLDRVTASMQAMPVAVASKGSKHARNAKVKQVSTTTPSKK